MSSSASNPNKDIYRELHDHIIAKRFNSPSRIRRYAHRSQYKAFLSLVPEGAKVLDAGCGEGVLSVMLARKGCRVTGIDISEPNITAARAYAEQEGVADRTHFLTGDIEQLPFEDSAFDYVVSSHVLEHIPNFEAGIAEVGRVARKRVIIAIPTCLNPAAMVLLGGDNYWVLSRHSAYALPYGFLRVMKALVLGAVGVNEGYEGRMELIHIRRFPWRGKCQLERAGLRVLKYRGSSYPFPYLSFLLPISRLLIKFAWLPLVREVGYGVTYVCEPKTMLE